MFGWNEAFMRSKLRGGATEVLWFIWVSEKAPRWEARGDSLVRVRPGDEGSFILAFHFDPRDCSFTSLGEGELAELRPPL